jgi:hypothetical protein
MKPARRRSTSPTSKSYPEPQAPAVRCHQHDHPPFRCRPTIAIATLGPGLPAWLPRISWRQPRPAPPSAPPAVPHGARRNIEMIAGILLRDIARAPLKLVFTSAAQRHQP